MSTTPNLASFNKDKVANKFGIQLKPKDATKQSQSPLTPLNEKKTINPEPSSVTKNKTVSDFRVQNDSNGLQTNTNTNTTKHSTSSTKNTLGNSTKSKSAIGLVSTINERRNSLTSNVNHSTSLKPVKPTPSIESLSNSPSSSSSKTPDTIKRSSLSPISIDRRLILTSKDRSVSPQPSSTQRSSITKPTERIISPVSSIKSQNILTTMSTTEAEIEHKKDQPLYKRQLSKTLDNATSIANKNKHQHELLTTSTTASKR